MEYVIKEKNGKIIKIRDVQKELCKILKEIDRICEKNNIEYFLTAGSCLGAVRHKGFIPWDDDADIGMSRKDYNRFIEALKKDLSDDYTFHCYEENKKYLVTWPVMKIRKKDTYIKEKNFLLKNKCKDSDGLFVDVFIYDHSSKSEIIDTIFRLTNTLLMIPIVLLENLFINPIPLKELYRFNAKIYGKLSKNSEYYGEDLTWVFDYKRFKTKYKDIYPTKKIQFEDTYLRVPGNYDNYLKDIFGNDYMIPIEESKRTCKHIKDIELNIEKQEH